MIPARDGWRYGLLGLPLAFAALPLYVHLPDHYARELGAPLAALGLLLMGARLLDALLDPWIGRLADGLLARSTGLLLAAAGVAACMLAAGFTLLFFPPSLEGARLLAWAAAAQALTYVAFSFLTVAHQAWGALLACDDAARARWVAWREGLGLAGVLLASVLPLLAGFGATATVLALALLAGWAAWGHAPRPQPLSRPPGQGEVAPLRDAGFRRLLAVFVLNGIASAVPATLVLFFVQDRLQAAPAQQPVFLAAYFLAAALSLPAWLRLSDRLGLARTWLGGMVLAVATFVFTLTLRAGDGPLFLAVCVLTGIALGADLAMPPSLLAARIAAAGWQGRGEGRCFGWWNLAAKLNLALAAGVALPLLAVAGYTPGTRDPHALAALSIAYCALPCALKCAAAALLHLHFIRPGESTWART